MRKRGENGKRESQSGYPRIIARLSQIRRAGKDGKERERSMKALEQRTFRGSDDDPFESKALSRKPQSRSEIYGSDGTGHTIENQRPRMREGQKEREKGRMRSPWVHSCGTIADLMSRRRKAISLL